MDTQADYLRSTPLLSLPLTTARLTQTLSSISSTITIPFSLGALTEHPGRTPERFQRRPDECGMSSRAPCAAWEDGRQAMCPARPEWEEPVLTRHLDSGVPARYSKQVTEVA
jgi:hypothetical protein